MNGAVVLLLRWCFEPNFKLQLVSLSQVGNEITQDSLKREGSVLWAELHLFFPLGGSFVCGCLNWAVHVVRADLSTLDPPVMEGVDELVAVSLKSSDSVSL